MEGRRRHSRESLDHRLKISAEGEWELLVAHSNHGRQSSDEWPRESRMRRGSVASERVEVCYLRYGGFKYTGVDGPSTVLSRGNTSVQNKESTKPLLHNCGEFVIGRPHDGRNRLNKAAQGLWEVSS